MNAMIPKPRRIRALWLREAPQYWWGDPLDVRFFLCEELSKLRNKKILDIGCNVGIALNCADDSNTKYGFDLDAKTIAIAPERGAETSIYLAGAHEVEGVSGQFFTRKKAVLSSRPSRDAETARRLWTLSAQMTGLSI